MPMEEQVGLANTLKVNLVQQPSKYLGVHFKLRGNRIADFQFLIDKLQAKLQGWKMKLLSQAGRTTLFAFVLQSLPLYSFACFKVPDAICSKMDSIIRAFWWVMIMENGNCILFIRIGLISLREWVVWG